MKRKLSFLLIYGTLVLLGGLGAVLLLFGEKTPHASLAENRMLAGFPSLSFDTVKDGSFMSGLEDYLSDNMPARNDLVAGADALMDRLSLRSQAADAQANDAQLAAQLAAYAQDGPVRTAEPTTPGPSETPWIPEKTPASQATAQPSEAETSLAPEATEAPASTPAQEKDLSDIQPCTFTLTQADGKIQTMYTFSPENIQRTIRMLNGFRAALPADGHVFFAQPPFPSVAFKLQDGVCVSWDGDLEDTINAYTDDGVYMISVQDVLEQHLLDGEYLYFSTDHHWTPRAACYALNAMLEIQGIDPRPYESYSFYVNRTFYGSAAIDNPGIRSIQKPDTLDVLIPDTPVKGYRIFWDKREEDAPLIYRQYSNYVVFMGGIQGPWRRFETGLDCGRSCLVIGDSFSYCFIPFLTAYYETIHATDIRGEYYDGAHAQWTISQYIQENGIDDVYFVLSTANGVNTVYIMEALLTFL